MATKNVVQTPQKTKTLQKNKTINKTLQKAQTPQKPKTPQKAQTRQRPKTPQKMTSESYAQALASALFESPDSIYNPMPGPSYYHHHGYNADPIDCNPSESDDDQYTPTDLDFSNSEENIASNTDQTERITGDNDHSNNEFHLVTGINLYIFIFIYIFIYLKTAPLGRNMP